MCMSLAALLLLYRTASYIAHQAQHLLQARYNSSRPVNSNFCDSHRQCFCMYMYIYALLYVTGMCAWIVRCHKINTSLQQPRGSSSTAPAVHQEVFRCASSHSVWVWLAHTRSSSHGNVFTSNTTFEHTSSDLIRSIRSIPQ